MERSTFTVDRCGLANKRTPNKMDADGLMAVPNQALSVNPNLHQNPGY